MAGLTALPLTAELLLLLHDETGKPLVNTQKRRAVTAGAAVTELALDGMLAPRLEGPGPHGAAAQGGRREAPFAPCRRPRPGGRPPPKNAIARIGGGQDFRLRADAIRDAVMGHLAEAGTVEAVEPRALRLVGPRWPLRRPEVEAAIRRRLEAALGGDVPSARTASLLALTHAGELLPKLFPARDTKVDARRVKEVVETEWHGDAVTAAIAELNTVMMSAVVVPIVVGGGS